MLDESSTIANLVSTRNAGKQLFTPGPASLLSENLTGLRPCFGRGDEDYAFVEEQVLGSLKAMTGHSQIARMQGSASLALEIATLNFLFGRVLVVSTGYYSDRLKGLAESAQRRTGDIRLVASVEWTELETASGAFDWILACYTETSCALRLPIQSLQALAKRTGAALLLDATASIGLEAGHEVADVLAYSSCKGLFGLTGAAFIAFNEKPCSAQDTFYLNLENHLEKKMTGPYHAIASLAEVLPRHADFQAAVRENKSRFMNKFADRLTIQLGHQPLLCTQVDGMIVSEDPRAVLYHPRGTQRGSVVCHLGEIHLGRQAQGAILDDLHIIIK